MKKTLCYILNLVMSVITTFVFLVKNGIIVCESFTEIGAFGLRSYTADFASAINITQLILGILCGGLMVYTFLVSKGMKKFKNIIITLVILCLAANFVGVLVVGSLTIFCYLHVVTSILLLYRQKNNKKTVELKL